MSDSILNLYHHLPPTLRSVVASIRGLYLRFWRYGPETARIVEETLDRDNWSSDRLKNFQEDRLAYVLHRAATRVPYYREQWASRRRKGDNSSWEYLENWPVLKKEHLRQNPLGFVADDRNVRWMFREQTSGTSGTPLTLWWSKETVRTWFGLCEARLRRWNGVTVKENWAVLGGQPVVSASTSRPPYWVWNASMNQLYLSANHLSPETVPAFIEALNHYSITHMIVYPSSGVELAREALNCNMTPQEMRVVISNAEPLFPWQRSYLTQGLKANVQETYGMAEIVGAAAECRASALHLWPEVGWVEILNDEDDVPKVCGSSGRLILTGLLNADMPLIRYEVGDRGSFPSNPSSCECGRTLPVISGIEGRINDMLIAPDGRRVFWVNPIFYGLPVCEAQVVQESLSKVRVLYVPSPAFTVQDQQLIISRLKARMGAINVVAESVRSIPRGSNGKFQPVICEVQKEQRE